MKKRTSRILISIISICLMITMLLSIISSVSLSVCAAEKTQYPSNYEAYGLNYNLNMSRGKKDMLVLSRLETIDNKIDELLSRPVTNNTTIINNTVIQNTLVGINVNGGSASKPKKTDAKAVVQKTTSVLNEINKELPGLIGSIKDGTFYQDYIENSEKALSIISSVAGMCGPYGQAAAAVIDVSQTIYKAIMGGKPASSETSKMEDRLTQQLQDIKNDLSNIEDSIKELSNELSESTQRIIDAMPVALERQDDKNRLEKFWKSYDGNFSYGDFYNYVNGATKGNSKTSSAYYALLQSALRNGGSDELVKRRYDDLYYVIDKDIKMFEDQIISDNNVKSIVKTYYDYVSSNEEWLAENQNTTPEMATIEFAHELYQTMQTADTILAFCHTYHYMQALLSQDDEANPEYFDYMGRFSFSFDQKELEDYYLAINTREENIQKQLANDIAEVLIGSNYIVEDHNNFYESSTGSVVNGQTVYLYQIPESICEWFDLDVLKYKYVTGQGSDCKQLEHFNYFEASNDSETVYLQYDGETVLTFTFSKNDNRFAGGTGTQSNPYLISTKEQFLKIDEGLDKHYQLTRDIDFQNAAISSIGLTSNSNGGDVVTAFNGSLDGNGFAIQNLKIGQPSDIFTGLFAKIGASGIVENLTFDNLKVNVEYGNIEQNNTELYAGIVTGYNLGLIRNCIFSAPQEKEGSLSVNSVFYKVTNKTINRTFSVYVGGVAGKNAGIISACQLIGVNVEGVATHSFAGESVNDNKVFVYSGGIAGYNSWKIGYSYFVKQDEHGKVIANATSTLSPTSNVSPYVTALSGGICGKMDENVLQSTALAELMECLYTDVSTVGTANIKFDKSNYTKGYKNRKENYNYDRELKTLEDLPDKVPNWMQWLNPWLALANYIAEDVERDAAIAALNKQKDKDAFEGSCYIPVHYGNYGDSVTAEKLSTIKTENTNSVLEQILAFQRKNYVVESITGLPAGEMSAATWGLCFDNLRAVVKDNGNNIDVKAISVISCYGFESLNTSKISNKKMNNIVFLLDIELENGDHIIYKATSTITLDINKLESIDFDFSFGTLSWMQSETAIEDLPNIPLTLETLYGMSGAKVVYNYTTTTDTDVYEYSKLKNPSITVRRLKTDEKGQLVVNEEGSPIIDENFPLWQSNDEILYTAGIGHYQATIVCTYDDQENREFFLEYEVYCPHLVWEVETFDGYQHHDATCKDLGYDEYTCKLCGDSIQRNIQPVTNEHKFEYEEVPATCYSKGETGSGRCSVCGLEIGEKVEIPQIPHDYRVIVYIANDGSLIYCKDGKNYSNESCTQILANPSFMEENSRRVSHLHLCTHQEEAGAYHTEQHQYQVSASLNDESKLVYTYSCECGYHYSLTDNEVVTPEYLKLPVISISQGYALRGGDEVVVYVQLLNNPGIYGANFGIRYDERLVLKYFEDGNVTEKSIITDNNEVSCGYNFVWANASELGEKGKDGNLLKLVFAVPEDVKKGDVFPIKVVYDIETGSVDCLTVKYSSNTDDQNKLTGGLAVKVNNKRTTETKLALTEDGTITIVDQLPGDVNQDGVVNILDAMELAKYSVGKITFESEKDRIEFLKRANVDLSDSVNLSDIVTILQTLTGGYGVNLLPQEFTIKLDYNGVDLNDPKLLNGASLPTSLEVSIYGENNYYALPNPQREGYHFDGWYTRMVDFVIRDEEGNIIDECKRVQNGDPVEYDSSQRVQTLYAHWTKNSVAFNGNGATNGDNIMPSWSYGQYTPNVPFRQEYKIQFKDGTSLEKLISTDGVKTTDPQTWSATIISWEARNESGVLVKTYSNLSEVESDLKKADFDVGITLYAIWQMPEKSAPNWSHQGYQENITWQYELSGGSYTLESEDIYYSNVIDKLGLRENPQKVGVLTAIFTPVTYTIKFDKNGGNGSKEENISLNTPNTTLSCPSTYTRVGYSYSSNADWGWSSNGQKLDSFAYNKVIEYAILNNKINSKNEITLYVQWNGLSYTIYYHANFPQNAKSFVFNSKTLNCVDYTPGASDSTKNKDVLNESAQKNISVGSNEKVLGKIYTITGWTFKGWSTSPTGKVNGNEGYDVVNQQISLDSVAIQNGNFEYERNLYAVWELDPWEVGTNVIDSEFEYGIEKGVKVCSTYGGTIYTIYRSQVPRFAPSSCIIDLREKNETINSIWGNEGENKSIIQSNLYLDTYIIGNPEYTFEALFFCFAEITNGQTRTVHMKDFHVKSLNDTGVFCNWHISNSFGNCVGGTVVFDIRGNCSVESILPISQALANQTVKYEGSPSNLTQYNDCKIILDRNNGTGGSGEAIVRQFTKNYVGTKPNAPTRSGYIFMGYYDQSGDGNGTQFIDASMNIKQLVNSSTTLYANWLKVSFTFDSGDRTIKIDPAYDKDFASTFGDQIDPGFNKAKLIANGYTKVKISVSRLDIAEIDDGYQYVTIWSGAQLRDKVIEHNPGSCDISWANHPFDMTISLTEFNYDSCLFGISYSSYGKDKDRYNLGHVVVQVEAQK